MEVNKEAAEQCLDVGARALKDKDYAKAIKFLKKSFSLYPLPGVEALLASAERAESAGTPTTNGASTSSSSSSFSSSSTSFNHNSTRESSSAATAAASSSSASSPATGTGNDGRAYTQAQVEIVEKVLRAKQGGRGAHYRVLQLEQTCTEAEIKKSYRKMALKLHPDKNSAPKADEAFKAVGLAYATLSDPQKRTIYDRYGEEDPDNRGGGGMRPGGGFGGPGGVHFRPGQEVSPEEIFNMFFGGMGGPGMGGGMHRGPGGMHFYTNFGGPGGMGGFPQQRRRRAAGAGQAQQQDDPAPGIATLTQLLPFLIIMILSFMNMGDMNSQGGSTSTSGKSQGLDRYFSLTVSLILCFHSDLVMLQL
jgi:DnaJ family protein B protein 12